MEIGIYETTLTMYASYYRHVSFPVYFLSEHDAEQYFAIAYNDVYSAFLTFIEQTDPERPFVLAGFSQGADMVIHLMKEFFDDISYQERLIVAYCIGWRVTEADADECPRLMCR